MQKVELAEQAGYKVLVVDDNEASAKTMMWTMELLGHQVKMVHNAYDAIETAKTYEPNIILLDIGLPGMDGYEACKVMHEIPALADSVFIAQTGWGQKEHRERSAVAGFDYHLVKPVEMNALQEILETSPKLNK